MAGKGKQRAPSEIPNIVRKPRYQILRAPFKQAAINRAVFDNKLRQDDRFYEKAEANICNKVKRKEKYVLYITWLGRELATAIETLEATRRLDVTTIKSCIYLTSHPAMRSSQFLKTTSPKRQLDDEQLLVWHTVLTDLYLTVAAHFTQVMETYRMTRMPEYKH